MKGELLGCFFINAGLAPPIFSYYQLQTDFDLLKSAKMNINFEVLKIDQFENLYLSSHGEARIIKFGHQVNMSEKVPLGTPPHEVLMSLSHNHMTNLFTLSYRGATVIEFGQ